MYAATIARSSFFMDVIASCRQAAAQIAAQVSEEIAGKTLFGTDWPSPGVPEIKVNLAAVREMPLTAEAMDAILSKNALKLWPV